MVDVRDVDGGVGRLLGRLTTFNQRHPWSHNDHFHGWILRNLPARRTSALDVGCGRGRLAHRLSFRFVRAEAIDADAMMVAAARAATGYRANVTVRQSDFLAVSGRYDLITMVAVLHHLDLEPALRRASELLESDGRLLVVGLARAATPTDLAWDLVSGLLNPVVGLIRHPHALRVPAPTPFPVRPPESSFDEIRSMVRRILPGARMRRRLFFRYTLEWTASAAARGRPGGTTSACLADGTAHARLTWTTCPKQPGPCRRAGDPPPSAGPSPLPLPCPPNRCEEDHKNSLAGMPSAGACLYQATRCIAQVKKVPRIGHHLAGRGASWVGRDEARCREGDPSQTENGRDTMSSAIVEPTTLSVVADDQGTPAGRPAAVGEAPDPDGRAAGSQDGMDYAADLAGALINLIRQFGALKVRLSPAGDYDVTQTFLLVRLVERGPIRATELAELACADPSTISRQVAGLVKAGLVERQADPADGRASLLVATDAGQAHIEHHRRLRGLALGPLVAGWSERDRADFLRLLRRLTRELDAHRDDIAAMLAQHRTDGSN
jgi:DNA-binding MarR family transcriptional regulator/SAM-dependent methyltransferase